METWRGTSLRFKFLLRRPCGPERRKTMKNFLLFCFIFCGVLGYGARWSISTWPCPLGGSPRTSVLLEMSLASYFITSYTPYSGTEHLIPVLCIYHFLFLIIHHHTGLLGLNTVSLSLVAAFCCPLVYTLAKRTLLYHEEHYQDTVISSFVLRSAPRWCTSQGDVKSFGVLAGRFLTAEITGIQQQTREFRVWKAVGKRLSTTALICMSEKLMSLSAIWTIINSYYDFESHYTHW